MTPKTEPTPHGHQSFWLWVMCLTGVDYFSTLGYQPYLAFRYAGVLAPLATVVLVAVTLFGALPVYRYIAGKSFTGQGSIAVMAMAEAGTPFGGVLYAGLMLTDDGPKLIEYNVRFGDPECEAIMPRIEGDFAALLYEVATGSDFAAPSLSNETTMTVVMAAKGYPGTPARGGAIHGLGEAEAVPGVTVFQAGTTVEDGQLVANGGRVLAVTARGRSLGEARDRAYQAIDAIDFADGFCRRDIGWRELERAEA